MFISRNSPSIKAKPVGSEYPADNVSRHIARLKSENKTSTDLFKVHDEQHSS